MDDASLADADHPEPTYTGLDFLIGLALVLGASVTNALGLNLAKRDLVHTQSLPRSQRTSWRPLNLIGMGLYILSQLIGSSLALNYLRAQWVAPLSSTSLIANLPLARWLVGTPITRNDIIGTAIVIVGVVGVVGFSNIKMANSIDEETVLDLTSLKRLWRRAGWLIYFCMLEFVSCLMLWAAWIMSDVLREREELEPVAEETVDRMARRNLEARHTVETTIWYRLVHQQRHLRKAIKKFMENRLHSAGDVSVRKWSALLWSTSGGLLSGQTLVYAKQTLKLASNGEPSQFGSLLPVVIIILLVVTAIAQIICLNRGLAAYDSTLVVPVFFAIYAGTSFLTSLVALDQVDAYSNWILAAISISLLVLTIGVIVLSSKKPVVLSQARLHNGVLDAEEDADELSETVLDQKRGSRSDALLPAHNGRVVWEVGDASLDESAKDGTHKPVEEDDDDERFGDLQAASSAVVR